MTVGIFGGSFNPIHLGHLQLAKILCRRKLTDTTGAAIAPIGELWFMVSPLNPFKQGNTDLLPDEVRLYLATLAVKGHPQLRVSDFEMHQPRPSYMVHTLEALRSAYPPNEFVLIIGADNWLRFPQWRESEQILRHHRLLLYPRSGYDIDTSTLPSTVQLVETPLFDISSTQIRQAIARGNYHGRGLSRSVWQEIRKQGYYR